MRGSRTRCKACGEESGRGLKALALSLDKLTLKQAGIPRHFMRGSVNKTIFDQTSLTLLSKHFGLLEDYNCLFDRR